MARSGISTLPADQNGRAAAGGCGVCRVVWQVMQRRTKLGLSAAHSILPC